MKNSYKSIYKVIVNLTEDSILPNMTIQDFILENFPQKTEDEDIGVTVLSQIDSKVELRWVVPHDEGVHEIENSLFYILKDGTYGTFSWESVE